MDGHGTAPVEAWASHIFVVPWTKHPTPGSHGPGFFILGESLQVPGVPKSVRMQRVFGGGMPALMSPKAREKARMFEERLARISLEAQKQAYLLRKRSGQWDLVLRLTRPKKLILSSWSVDAAKFAWKIGEIGLTWLWSCLSGLVSAITTRNVSFAIIALNIVCAISRFVVINGYWGHESIQELKTLDRQWKDRAIAVKSSLARDRMIAPNLGALRGTTPGGSRSVGNNLDLLISTIGERGNLKEGDLLEVYPNEHWNLSCYRSRNGHDTDNW